MAKRISVKHIPDDQKIKLYLEQFFQNQRKAQPKERVPVEKDTVVQDLIATFPNQKEKIQSILRYLGNAGINWTPTREIMVDNEVIWGSNLMDIFAYILQDRKKGKRPQGFDLIQPFLTSVPKTLIKNKRTWKKF